MTELKLVGGKKSQDQGTTLAFLLVQSVEKA